AHLPRRPHRPRSSSGSGSPPSAPCSVVVRSPRVPLPSAKPSLPFSGPPLAGSGRRAQSWLWVRLSWRWACWAWPACLLRDQPDMTELTFRDATPDDIVTILELSHAGDARGADAPPLD